MKESQPVTMLVTYRAKQGKETELRALVEKHGKVLRGLGLVTAEPVRAWQAHDKRGHGDASPYFVEILQWRDAEASDIAHQTPEVMAIWEPMGPILEELRLTTLEPMAAH